MLSAPAGLDGSSNKVIVNIPTLDLTSTNTKRHIQLRERREKIRQMLKGYLDITNENEKESEKLLDKLVKEIVAQSKNILMESDENDARPLTNKKEKIMFEGIRAKNELNFFQKLELFQMMGLHIRLPADVREKFEEYVRLNAAVELKEKYLKEYLKNISADKQFVARYKLLNYLEGTREFNGLHKKNISYDDQHRCTHRKINSNEAMELETDPKDVVEPVRKWAQINHVVFGTREYSHFVIVCTEKRLVIWNLLTTRLHAALKLTVKHIAVDPYTSLIAAFTFFDECKLCVPLTQCLKSAHQFVTNLYPNLFSVRVSTEQSICSISA